MTENVDNAKNGERRITKVRMPDGTIAPVVYMTEESQQPEYIRQLIRLADEAGRNAVRKLLEAGIPAYYLKDGNLVCLHPDGHEEVIEKLEIQ